MTSFSLTFTHGQENATSLFYFKDFQTLVLATDSTQGGARLYTSSFTEAASRESLVLTAKLY